MDTQSEEVYMKAKQQAYYNQAQEACLTRPTQTSISVHKVVNGWLISHYQHMYVAQTVEQAILIMQALCDKAIKQLDEQ